MAIESHSGPGGGFSVTGARDVSLLRLVTMRAALRMEIRTNGRMKVTRGPKMTTRLRREFGITGNRHTQMAKLCRLIDTAEAARPDIPENERLQPCKKCLTVHKDNQPCLDDIVAKAEDDQ